MATKLVKHKWETWGDFLELRDYVVVDVVTTGQSPEKEKIIELGMIRVEDGVVTERFHSLVNPERSIPTRVENAIGIAGSDVEPALTFAALSEDITRILGGSVVISPNGSLGAKFLAKELSNCGYSMELSYFDFDALVQKAFPLLESFKLVDLVQSLELEGLEPLRARDGAEATLQIVQRIYDNYDSVLARAVGRCCSPIVDYRFDCNDPAPLAGKRVAVLGDLTFSVANARKLVEAAGGVLDAKLSKDTDILVYGYFDPHKHPKWMAPAVRKVYFEHQKGAKTEAINEVALLKKCGASLFLGNERSSQTKELESLDSVLSNAQARSNISGNYGRSEQEYCKD